MTLVDAGHGWLVHPRRVRVLAERAAQLLPPGARVLDVGAGDGQLAAAVLDRRADLRIEGIDVLVRPATRIPVSSFDGRRIPRPDRSVDAVMLIDVLHHADDPAALLREAVRVARTCVVLKDHVCQHRLARAVLRVMDHVGNAKHGVALPHNYWSRRQWADALGALQLEPAVWDVGGLGLYPWPADLIVGGSLHVMARLNVPPQAA